MKRFFAMILVLALLVGILPVTASGIEPETSGSCGSDATWEVDPHTHTLRIKGTGAMDFDSYYFEAPWTPWEEEIRVIVIEEGITEAWGFHTCKWVEWVSISSTVTDINYEDFQEAIYLEYIDVAEGNTVYSDMGGVLFTKDQKTLLRFPGGYKGRYTVPETVTYIAEQAFSNSNTLLEVVLPEGLTELQEETFYGCASLASVKLPQSLKKIRRSAFERCLSLESVELPQGLTTIESGAFWYSGMSSVTIPDSVTKYGGAFNYCYKLESLTAGRGILSHLEDDYRFSPNLKTVRVSSGNPAYYCDERGVLYNQEKTELLAAPRSITGEYAVLPGTGVIGYMAFDECYALKKVQLPPSVTGISEQAFDGCISLEEINLEGVTWYGMAALCGCESLKEIKLSPEQPYFDSYVFMGCGITEIEIPDGYTEVGEDLFAYSEKLENVTLPNTLVTIQSGAFAGTAIESITLPESLENIGYGAFEDCKKLKELRFPEENENFSTDASGVVYNADKTELYFAPAEAGDLIILADTVERISTYAFAGGTVRTVVIPGAITDYEVLWNICGDSIEKFIVADTNPAFAEDEQGGLYNKDLSHLLQLPQGFRGAYYAPEQMASAEWDAFEGCKGLTEIHVGKAFGDPDSQLPNMVNVPAFYVSEDHPDYYNDDKGVLYSADGTRLIYAPKDLTGDYVLPATVTKIYRYAFSDCRKLTSVDMSACDIRVIPENCFAYCTALEEVRLSRSLQTVESCGFGDCVSLRKVELPEGTSVLESYAFGNCTALTEVTLPDTLREMFDAFSDCSNLRTVRFMGNAPLDAAGAFVCYDEKTGIFYLPPKLTMEFTCTAKGFTTPYWKGISTRVFSPIARNCDGTACTCTDFADVPAVGHWAHNAIEEMLYVGLFNGVGDNRFNPDGTMTRAMLVTILYRWNGEPSVGACTFTDVPENTWYTDAVAWAAEEGIVNGVGNNRFAPNQPVTREQVATILTRALSVDYTTMDRKLGWLGYFSDEDRVSDYARPSLETMVGLGVINGKGTKLDPLGTATRAEVATILWRWNEYASNTK